MQVVIDWNNPSNNHSKSSKIRHAVHYLKRLFFLVYLKLNLSPYELSINRQRKYFKLEYNSKIHLNSKYNILFDL